MTGRRKIPDLTGLCARKRRLCVAVTCRCVHSPLGVADLVVRYVMIKGIGRRQLGDQQAQHNCSRRHRELRSSVVLAEFCEPKFSI